MENFFKKSSSKKATNWIEDIIPNLKDKHLNKLAKRIAEEKKNRAASGLQQSEEQI